MTLVLIGKGLVLGGWPSKIEVIWVPGIYIYIHTHTDLSLFFHMVHGTSGLSSSASSWESRKDFWECEIALGKWRLSLGYPKKTYPKYSIFLKAHCSMCCGLWHVFSCYFIGMYINICLGYLYKGKKDRYAIHCVSGIMIPYAKKWANSSGSPGDRILPVAS